MLAQVGAQFDDLAMVAARESERRNELAALAPTMLVVPWMAGDIHDVAGLGLLADASAVVDAELLTADRRRST